MEEQPERGSPGDVLPFLTTEHFTLQTERSSASGDTNARLQLYMMVLSSSIIALALVAQVAGVADAFRGFAMVLLPTVYVFGIMTIGRMRQLWRAWFDATRGMNRIRHFYVETAPETAPYFVMPTTDDPWTTLHGSGIGKEADVTPWAGLYTAQAALVIVNSVVAAAFVGVASTVVFEESTLVPAIPVAAGFIVSFLGLAAAAQRDFRREVAKVDVRFPPASPP